MTELAVTFFRCPAPDFTEHADSDKDVTVKVPVSISYNGGTVIEGKWYAGYEVPAPIVPKGFKLVDIGVGLQMNAHPPYATLKLVKEPTSEPKSKSSVAKATRCKP